MKTYTKLLEEIKDLREKFISIPHYYGMLRRIEAENEDLKKRVEKLESELRKPNPRLLGPM
jgi:hypothetical protein